MKYILSTLLLGILVSCFPTKEESIPENNNAIPHKEELKRYANLLEKNGQKNDYLSWVLSEEFNLEQLEEDIRYLEQQDSGYTEYLKLFNEHTFERDSIRKIRFIYVHSLAQGELAVTLECTEDTCFVRAKGARWIETDRVFEDGRKQVVREIDSFRQGVSIYALSTAVTLLNECFFWNLVRPLEQVRGFDGSNWILEVSLEPEYYPYHRVSRWSPYYNDSYKSACEYLVSLFDPSLGVYKYMGLQKPPVYD